LFFPNVREKLTDFEVWLDSSVVGDGWGIDVQSKVGQAS